MAKRPAAPPPVFEVPVGEALEQERKFEQEQQKNLEIDAWLAEFRSRFSEQAARVCIEKYVDNEWLICKKYPLNTFDHEAVRDEFGGGRYRAILIGADGRYIKEGRNYFQFADPLPKPIAAKEGNPLENPIVAMMIKTMEASQAQTLEITKALIAGGSGAGGKGSDIGQLIVALKGLQDLAPKDKPMESFKDTLNMMKLVKEVTGDGESSKGGLISEIRDFLEIWPAVREKFAEIKPALPAPAAPTVASTPNVPERKPIVMDPLTDRIVKLVPKYVVAAKKAEPIETWGDTLLADFDTEILPVLFPMMKKQYGVLVKDEDDVYDILLRYAKDPKEREVIFKDITPLAPFREWVNRVVDEAIRLAETDAEPGPADVVLEAVAGTGAQAGG